MAREYICLSKNKTEDGIIGISLSSFEEIARLCLKEQSDIRIAEASTFTNNCTCRIVDNKVVININVLVKAGVNVNNICRSVQENITDYITHMTDLTNVTVNLNITGFYIA